MDGTVYVKRYTPLPLDRKEILRYAGAKEVTDEVAALMESCIVEAEGVLSYQVCYAVFPVGENDGILDLGFAQTNSENLRKNLRGCQRVAVFGATVGLGLDRLIARYGRTSRRGRSCFRPSARSALRRCAMPSAMNLAEN